MISVDYKNIKTKPFEGQKPGTSGLRKPTKVFMQRNYTENFVLAILQSCNCRDKTLILGGDGRFYCKEACAIILSMCAGFGVSKVIVGRDGILSTPAVSCLIRKHSSTVGGIILTASHNPGGLDADFGIKFNTANGGPAPESITNQIYTQTLGLTEFRTCPKVEVDLSKVGVSQFTTEGGTFEVCVIDPVTDYADLMEEVFDFDVIRKFLNGGKGFKVTLNSLNGVMGPYVHEILCGRLGVPVSDVNGCVPLPDFGGRHPDPNLTYASDLVELMRSEAGGAYDMGVAFDGDGDRNMILGQQGFFVSPCDSLAVLAANLDCIPYFQNAVVKGLARSMPTAAAVDKVAERKNIPMYIVPTGWKYFGSLMDAGKLSLCGEESFGTGSDHIREKDGLWTVLAWLSILAEKKINVETLMKQHWMEYGRNYFTRYDYENIDVEPADLVMERLESLIFTKTLIGKTYKESICGCKPIKIEDMYNFTYKDPVNGQVSNNQGIVISFTDGSRIVFRKGGTGSTGATIRMYIDSYIEDRSIIYENAQETLKPFINIAMDISQLKAITGREKPDVIT